MSARVGLVGNPSDAYGGHVVAFTVAELRARVTARAAASWCIVDGRGGRGAPITTSELRAAIHGSDLHEGAELLGAAAMAAVEAGLDLEGAEIGFETTIPRQVGLGGSSAIVIAALRALAALCGHRWEAVDLARVALWAETDVLGLSAGPQDRVVQAMGGLVDMDFAEPWQPTAHQRLDPSMLPPVLLAWSPGAGESSTVPHTDVRRRWDEGDEVVHEVMRAFRRLGLAGGALFEKQADAAALADLLDEAFALRCRIWNIGDADAELASLAARHGAGATLAGSGGALVMVPRRADGVQPLGSALQRHGAVVLAPTVGVQHA